jgi:hypothetical protein
LMKEKEIQLICIVIKRGWQPSWWQQCFATKTLKMKILKSKDLFHVTTNTTTMLQGMEWLMWESLLFSLGSASHLVPWLNSSSEKNTHTHTHTHTHISYKLPWTWIQFPCMLLNKLLLYWICRPWQKTKFNPKAPPLIPLLSTPKIIQIPWSWGAWAHHTWVECGRRLWTKNKKSTSQKSGSCSDTQIYIIKIYIASAKEEDPGC